MSCEHEDFVAHVEVNRLANVEDGPIDGFSVDLRVECIACGEPFCFRGLPLGLSQLAPTMSLDGTVLTAPIHPMSDPTYGIGLPGFAVQIHDREK